MATLAARVLGAMGDICLCSVSEATSAQLGTCLDAEDLVCCWLELLGVSVGWAFQVPGTVSESIRFPSHLPKCIVTAWKFPDSLWIWKWDLLTTIKEIWMANQQGPLLCSQSQSNKHQRSCSLCPSHRVPCIYSCWKQHWEDYLNGSKVSESKVFSETTGIGFQTLASPSHVCPARFPKAGLRKADYKGNLTKQTKSWWLGRVPTCCR